MAIECYTTECPFHSCWNGKDEGPFCNESECRQPAKELNKEKIDYRELARKWKGFSNEKDYLNWVKRTESKIDNLMFNALCNKDTMKE